MNWPLRSNWDYHPVSNCEPHKLSFEVSCSNWDAKVIDIQNEDSLSLGTWSHHMGLRNCVDHNGM